MHIAWPFFRRRRARPSLNAIYITAAAGQPMRAVNTVYAIAASGLQGDRYSEARGFWKASDACQVTLIGEMELARAKRGCSAELRNLLDTGHHRRNLLIGGIDSKDLQGKTFRIGGAKFRYHKPRPPCAYLDKTEGHGMSRALGRHSGACIEVVSSGNCTIGDDLEIIDT